MSVKVLIAHAKGEGEEAERLAAPIRSAGYEVSHQGTVLVGDSVVGEASRLLAEGGPVVLCGTVRAVGTKWARQVAQAARAHPGVRLFVVQMEEDADTDTVAFDETLARYWQDPAKAAADLVAALRKWYPPQADAQAALRTLDLEAQYRALALKACDIVDLANLPEDDRHLASRELELRRLYVPLRMRIEIQAGDEVDDRTLKALSYAASTAGAGPGRATRTRTRRTGSPWASGWPPCPGWWCWGTRARARVPCCAGWPPPTCCASSRPRTGRTCQTSAASPTGIGCPS